MIGKIKGKLVDLQDNTGLIETVSGVSYELFLPFQIISKIHIGDDMEVLTYLQVREDAFVLFGFQSVDQQRFFKLLLSVSGVGPKTAFNVVSHTETSDLLSAVRNNDLAYFTQIPGLGKKTALKIILELSQKIKSEFKWESVHVSDDDKTAIDALISLGYKSTDAKKIISQLPAAMTVEDKIKAALKQTHEKK